MSREKNINEGKSRLYSCPAHSTKKVINLYYSEPHIQPHLLDGLASNSSIKRCDIKTEKMMRTRTWGYQDGENRDSELPQQQLQPGWRFSGRLTNSIRFCFCFQSLSHVHVWMHRSRTVTGVRVDVDGGHELLNLLCGGTMCTLRTTSCLCVSHPTLYLSIPPCRNLPLSAPPSLFLSITESQYKQQ